jgi:lariat debranching enzyme
VGIIIKVGSWNQFKGNELMEGHYEKMPLDRSTMRSIYHIRNYDVMKIKQVRNLRNTQAILS